MIEPRPRRFALPLEPQLCCAYCGTDNIIAVRGAKIIVDNYYGKK